MTSIRLKKLLKKQTGTVIQDLAESMRLDIGIQDTDGKWLLGNEKPEFSLLKHPIELEGETLGWVIGPKHASSIATLLSHLAEREFEKRSLTQETLERYKEINLLYTISAKMASCLEPQAIAQLVIDEARRLIRATSASIMLLNPDSNTLDILAAFGTAMSTQLILGPGQGVAGNVLINGKGVIINNVELAPEFIEGPNKISSLLCIPLKVEEKIIGVMNISSEAPVTYTAGDLKLATALASQAAVSIENARLQAERLERERMMQELEIARNIQQSLLPDNTPVVEGADVTALSLPAKQVGGDFFDFIPISDNKLGLVIADVSGKGVPAALFMALSRALMRANSLNDPRVSHSVIQTNRLILDCATSGLFVTLFYAIINTQTRTLKYVSAGHNPPILYKNRTGDIQMLEADGIALGVMDDIELEEKEITLEEDDLLVLYTDGVTEATNLQDEEFGEQRLIQYISEHHTLSASQLIMHIKDAAMSFAGEAPQFDDFTLMIVKIT
jgi:sigma-B regulation protein RsbU (phosphoserine phosphatase)